jgi:hypothetical protein
MNIPEHISESLETIFFCQKYSNSLTRIRIRDVESFDPGSGMEKFGSGIRDKPPGFATLVGRDGVKKSLRALLAL